MRNPFYVRCYAKRIDGQWVAVCIDLCLAAQADTYQEAKAKLEAQIQEYVYEALTIDREHAQDLLNRKAPLANRIEYLLIRLAEWFRNRGTREQVCRPSRAFEELISVPA